MKEDSKDKLAKFVHQLAQPFISDAKLQEIFDETNERIDKSVADGVIMQFWLYGHNLTLGKWVLMPCIFGDWPPPEPMTKDEAMVSLGVKFAQEFPDFKLVAISHMSESWMVQREPGDNLNITPSVAKDRVEAVIAHVMTIDKRISFSCRKIVRDEEAKYLHLEPLIEEIYDPEAPEKGMEDHLSTGIIKGWLLASEGVNYDIKR